jgi:hypothetical protein
MFERLNFRRLFVALLLACSLPGVQLVLVEHGIEHACHDHDDACVECLVLPGMQAVPKQAACLPVQCSSMILGDGAVPPAPTFARWLAFHSRAPPELHR